MVISAGGALSKVWMIASPLAASAVSTASSNPSSDKYLDLKNGLLASFLMGLNSDLALMISYSLGDAIDWKQWIKPHALPFRLKLGNMCLSYLEFYPSL